MKNDTQPSAAESRGQHTPGPWTDSGHDGKHCIAVESKTGTICAVWRANGGECQAADARLIAAAPELLAAAESAKLILAESGFGPTGMSDDQLRNLVYELRGKIAQANDALNAAIAKAEGRS